MEIQKENNSFNNPFRDLAESHRIAENKKNNVIYLSMHIYAQVRI